MGKKPRQKQTAQPHWQPISMLPTFATHIDGMLEADLEQYETLSQARGKLHVFDDFMYSSTFQCIPCVGPMHSHDPAYLYHSQKTQCSENESTLP